MPDHHSYTHRDNHLNPICLPVGKVVCVGQNYHDHIAEMGSKVNEQAVLFMKPNTAICALDQPLTIPQDRGECHNEVEVAVLINQPLTNVTPEQALEAIWGYGLGLDLTLREVQRQLKELGRPWERAKSFDNSAPLSSFTSKTDIENAQDINFSLTVNNELRQRGNTKQMIRNIGLLLSIISNEFTLLPGDVVLTGTPAGVAPLYSGDQLDLTFSTNTYSANYSTAVR